MDEKELLFQQYRLYVESKDRFVDRSFTANRFYLGVCLVLIGALWGVHNFPQINFLGAACIKTTFLSSCAISLLGIFASIMWWINNDAYRFLAKIKLSSVIEEMEKQLPFQPHVLEFEHIQNRTKSRKTLFFGDFQMAFSVLFIIIFTITFISDILVYYNAHSG